MVEEKKELSLITFFLAGGMYGIELDRVSEIIPLVEITPVPKSPSFMKGIIDLRGSAVPILDLREKLGLAVPQHTKQTPIIIVDIDHHLFGLLVDSIWQILTLDAQSLFLLEETSGRFVKGAARLPTGLLLLLDLEKAVSVNEIGFSPLLHQKALQKLPEEEQEKIGILDFALGGEFYGVDITATREIVKRVKITPIPLTPPFIEGVINLRGRVLSVINLKKLFHLDSGFQNGQQVLAVEAANLEAGLLVDSIGGVVDSPCRRIEPPLSTLDKVVAEYIWGEIRLEEKVLGLLNLENILKTTRGEGWEGDQDV